MARRGTWTELGKTKLQSSGLTSSIGDQLGMYEIPSAMLLDKSFEARPALVIPYMGTDKQPAAAHPRWPNFYRIRYLDKPAFGFKEAAGAKDQRYAQPPGSGTCAYFPTNCNWEEIKKDPGFEIIFTEGELKAAAACEADFPTIGLGGVWNFRSSKEGIWFLPELEQFDWIKRTVYICFDSDYMEKPNVCLAINGLCEELQERGAYVRVLMLPGAEDDKKVGLDDYLLENTPEDLAELLRTSEPLGISKSLWQMNKEVMYVENPGLVVVEEDGQKLSADMFKGHSRWATASAIESKVGAKGDILREKVPGAPVWLRWPLRRSVKAVTYAPGEPKITEDNKYNQWGGWGTKPKKGDVAQWLKLTKFIFGSAEPGVLDWFYDWCAYPIQNPGAKLFSGVVIHGIAQGTGKTLIGYHLGLIYGKNFKEIKDDDLEQSFWAENKQFILGDEITGKDNRAYMNTLKRLITGSTVDINIKFIPQYELPNCMNFMFTSQHGDSFFLEDKDRRFLVVEVQDDPLPEEFYLAYDKWYKNEGAAALHQWLLDRKISPKFNPAAAPPRTAAKERMIAATKGDVASWVAELKAFPDQTLRLGQMRYTRDLFTSKELLTIYEQDHPNSKVTAVGLGRQLSAAGCVQVADGQPVIGPDGKAARYFAIRNIAEWKREKSRKFIEKHLQLQPVTDRSARK